MYSKVATTALHGIISTVIYVEADVSDGMPVFEMVGILSSEVREAKERIKAAVRNSGFSLMPKKITINLFPADLKKSGTGFDLPIALAVLAAYGHILPDKLQNSIFVGEIALDGTLLPVKGILPMVIAAKDGGYERMIVPYENGPEASYVSGIEVIPAKSLSDVISYMEKGSRNEAPIYIEETDAMSEEIVDFSELNGQYLLRRACEVAACGMHNLLISGPPGSGKTMAAKALPSILPKLDPKEQMELARIYSVSGLFDECRKHIKERPFRNPHHSVTKAALVGGGNVPEPGEISLAHKGILFLDELTEYSKPVLEQLRQPLEDREIILTRVTGTYRYPADFVLVAAMNPCNCGFYPDLDKCTCTPTMRKQYLQRISRPLLDRIDMTIQAPRMTLAELQVKKENESSKQIRERVERVHEIQKKRFYEEAFSYNSRIRADKIEQYCPMTEGAKKCIEAAYDRLQLSARSYHKVIRVARTIADMSQKENIEEQHMMEALMYRSTEMFFGREM